jgi:hypothetical protein
VRVKYRATIRYVSGVQRYHVVDLEADSLEHALRALVEAFPSGLESSADLLEVRRQVDVETRPQSPA